VRGHLAPMPGAGQIRSGPAASRHSELVRDQLDNKGLLQNPVAGRGESIGPGYEVSKLV
jgi:hypothetical protein